MKAKLFIDGKEFEVEISETELNKLDKRSKQTGYERAGTYWMDVMGTGCSEHMTDCGFKVDQCAYDVANYYSDKTVCANNARADKLMRQLRRFAVEHRKEELDWDNVRQMKYYFHYNNLCTNPFYIRFDNMYHIQGVIYFDSEETTQLAIDTFYNELVWYFTEYKDSL